MKRAFKVGDKVKVQAHGPISSQGHETPEFIGVLAHAESGQFRAWKTLGNERDLTCMHPEFWEHV